MAAPVVDYILGDVLMHDHGSNGISQADADLRYVNVTGDTMTGNLTLNGGNIVMTGAETVDGIDISAIPTTYLKLDASNDPLTGGLTIQPATDTLTALVVNDKDANNILTVDTINNRLGIGTATPTQLLHLLKSAGDTTVLSTVTNATVVEGANSPSTEASDASVGTVDWDYTTLGTALLYDQNYAIAQLITATSKYLKTTDFGFNIPSDATVVGIKVEIAVAQVAGAIYGCSEAAVENSVKIVKAGTPSGTDKSTGAGLNIWYGSGNVAYITYGGSSDLWGLSWTPDDINNSGFGFAYSVVTAGFDVPVVDHVKITVYCTLETVNWAVGADFSTGAQFKISNNSEVGTNDRLVIERDGRIGIGTSSPTARLHIESPTVDTGILNLVSTDDSSAHSFITLRDSGGLELMRINSDHTTNVFMGYLAGASNTVTGTDEQGEGNVFIGGGAGKQNTTGRFNIAIGESVLEKNTTGENNVGIGRSTLKNTTTGYNNFALGTYTLIYNTTGYKNIGIGTSVLQYNTTGYYNVGIGADALYLNTTGICNVAIGGIAMRNLDGGSNNTAIGDRAGIGFTTASNNILLGYRVGGNITTGSDNIIIAFNTNAPDVGTSDYLQIGDYLKGDLGGASLIGASLQITAGASPQLAIIVKGQTLLDDKLIFTQTDGNEYIDSLNDGYLDLGATTGIRLTSPRTTVTGDLYVGNNAAADPAIVFDGDTNDGQITWKEDEDYFQFEDDFYLAQSVYNDANVGGLVLQTGGTLPGIVEILNSAGAGTGIYSRGFAIGEQGSGCLEIPHDYKEGTNLVFHVHWVGQTAPAGGTDNVKWQLTYSITRGGVVTPAVTTDSAEVAYTTQYSWMTTDVETITGTNLKIGDQLNFTITRIAASADDYAGELVVGTMGIHYECDTMGSRQIGTK